MKVFEVNLHSDVRFWHAIAGIIALFWGIEMVINGLYFSPFKNPSAVRIVIASLFWIWVILGVINVLAAIMKDKVLIRSLHWVGVLAGCSSLVLMVVNFDLFPAEANFKNGMVMISFVLLLMLDILSLVKQHGVFGEAQKYSSR